MAHHMFEVCMKKKSVVVKKKITIQIRAPGDGYSKSKWCETADEAAAHWASIRSLPLFQKYRYTPYNLRRETTVFGNDRYQLWRHYEDKLVRRTLPIFQKVFV